MIDKRAIELAIKGGWKKGEQPDIFTNNDGIGVQFFGGGNTGALWVSDIALDPSFWQSLGKELGWSTDFIRYETWQDKARRFYDLILTGQSTEKFWADLLANK